MTPRKHERPEEFRARQRARYAAADPEYREGSWRGSGGTATRDSVYREQLLKRQRDRYANYPEYRQQIVERQRKRYSRKMKGSNL
jgi:hypothetical protein